MIVVTNTASVRGPTEIFFWRINKFALKLLKFKCAFKRSQNENANPLLINFNSSGFNVLAIYF